MAEPLALPWEWIERVACEQKACRTDGGREEVCREEVCRAELHPGRQPYVGRSGNPSLSFEALRRCRRFHSGGAIAPCAAVRVEMSALVRRRNSPEVSIRGLTGRDATRGEGRVRSDICGLQHDGIQVRGRGRGRVGVGRGRIGWDGRGAAEVWQRCGFEERVGSYTCRPSRRPGPCCLMRLCTQHQCASAPDYWCGLRGRTGLDRQGRRSRPLHTCHGCSPKLPPPRSTATLAPRAAPVGMAAGAAATVATVATVAA
jgi:hypothetical protein